MIRIEIELSAPQGSEGTVLAVAESVASVARDRLDSAGIVVHRIVVEEADA